MKAPKQSDLHVWDALFTKSQHHLRSNNTLRGCKPSRLNFGSNCSSVADLQHLLTKQYPNSSLTIENICQAELGHHIAADVRPAIPFQYANASDGDICEYWTVLERTGSCSHFLDPVYWNCSATYPGIYLSSLAHLNLTADCSTVEEFSRRLQTDSDVLDLYSEPLFRHALPSHESPPSNWSVTFFAQQILRDPGAGFAIAEAANNCTPSYCTMSGFTGNADIAGQGAVISYGIMAGIASVVAINLAVDFLRMGPLRKHAKVPDPNDPNRTLFPDMKAVENPWRAAGTASLAFHDAVLYLTIMTSVAACYYQWHAHTLYEFALSALVAFLVSNATFLTSIAGYLPQDKDDKTLRLAVLILGSWPCCIVPIHVLHSIYQNDLFKYSDVNCFNINDVAKIVLEISAIFQTITRAICVLATVTVIPISALRSRPRRLNIADNIITALGNDWLKLLLGIVIVLEFIFMWANFAGIIIIRDAGREHFGPTFGDFSFGYGQIMALGFCLQVLFVFAGSLLF